MENHRAASARLRVGNATQHAKKSTNVSSRRVLTLRDWPVSWRLITVIVMALVMGLVFGGLRVAAATASAAQFGRVVQLADLGEQVTGLVQALENERDETAGVISGGSAHSLTPWYNATNVAAARVLTLASGIGGSFPANIQNSVATVESDIAPSAFDAVRETARSNKDALTVIVNYTQPINDMITLNDEIAQDTSDAALAIDVRTLNWLSLAKEQAAQQRALLFNSFTQRFFGDGEQQALSTALSEEFIDEASFETTATPAEQNSFRDTIAGQGVDLAEEIEDFVITGGSRISAPLDISLAQAPTVWYTSMSDKINDMQAVELEVAGNIVARAQALQSSAEQSALVTAAITAAALLIVLIATLAIARSLVRPLRRLRAGALDIASVQLPERVRQLSEAMDPATGLEVAPIDVLSADEIGQVARAFDQVHAEAVRLAGNEAMLRSSFNAMFVNLSRRSQSLIERLARTIDSLEQNEDDPNRLSNLFTMDHLVTRMRRNSENLLLLAGHESARKWSEPVPLADVARAATSEIEQYSRVTLNIQPGASVTGQAVSDVVHLLAEVIENANTFSPRDTPVRVSAQELTSGGVLIEVSDNGVGIPDAMLAEINWRLDNPPVIDVSVSRHMGLFAVARLAERHKIRVRLRSASPQGVTALVWLPDGVIERGTRAYGGRSQLITAQGGPQGGRMTGAHSTAARSAPQNQPANDWREPAPSAWREPAVSAHIGAGTRESMDTGTRPSAQAGGVSGSNWFSRYGSFPATPQADFGRPSGLDGWSDGMQAAQIISDPVRGEQTAAGLPVRVPQANLIPGSAGRRADYGGTSHSSGGYETQTSAAPRPQRSPELARSRLSGFQRGVRRGKDRTFDAGEGADR
jgi:signal transduction histidine kinase